MIFEAGRSKWTTSGLVIMGLSDRVIADGEDGESIVCLDEANGQRIWAYHPPVLGPLVPIADRQGKLLAITIQNWNGVIVLDAANGREIGQIQVGSFLHVLAINEKWMVVVFKNDKDEEPVDY